MNAHVLTRGFRSDSRDRREFLKRSAALVAGATLFAPERGARADDRPPAAEVPWLDEVQRKPDKVPPTAPKLGTVLQDAAGRPISTLEDWERRRAQLRESWAAFIGEMKLDRSHNRFEVLEEDRPRGCVRQLIRYESEPGLPVEAYLLKPNRLTGRVPGVVAMHSTCDQTIRQPAGVEGDPEDFFGLKLAQRGCIVVCPRCFLWQGAGSYEEHVTDFKRRHPGAKGMAKMLWDATRALDLLCGLPEIDAERLGSVGHSLGAKETLYLAAFDERVKAAVSSEGGIGTTFSNWDADWYLGPEIRPGGFGREHHELLALVAPRAFLLIGGDSADGAASWPFIEAALPVYRLYSSVCRIGLFNHGKGHAVPPPAEDRLYGWLRAYL